jgi:hypothetical protein
MTPQQRYRERNREKLREAGRVYREENLEAIYERRNVSKEDRLRYQRKYRASIRGMYATHKGSAVGRGIEFHLSFNEWLSLWEPYLDGKRQGGYVMCRTADLGPYALGNVRIDTQSNNAKEYLAIRWNLIK